LKTYSGGGSVQNLHPEELPTLQIIRELREFLWVDRSTRIVIVRRTLILTGALRIIRKRNVVKTNPT